MLENPAGYLPGFYFYMCHLATCEILKDMNKTLYILKSHNEARFKI